MWRIDLTGWEIFSKLDAVKWNLNQAEDISPRVFRLVKGPSIPESNQRGKRNENHMNPLIQLKKTTPLFVIALVLACFALSPQALAAPVANPTFTPLNWSGCQHLENVTISTTTIGTNVRIQVRGNGGWAGMEIANNTTIPVGRLGTLTICAQAYRWINGNMVDKSGWVYSTYTCNCPGNQHYCLQ